MGLNWNWCVLNESVVSLVLFWKREKDSFEKSGSKILLFFLRTRYKTPNGATGHLVQCGNMDTDSMPYSVSAATSHVNRNVDFCGIRMAERRMKSKNIGSLEMPNKND